VAVSTAVGTVAMLTAALTGKHDDVAVADVLDGSVDTPRAYRDWIGALVDIARR
jgi:hypothetical protein